MGWGGVGGAIKDWNLSKGKSHWLHGATVCRVCGTLIKYVAVALSLIVRSQQRCLRQCLCASRFGMSCWLKAFRHQVHFFFFFVIICMNLKLESDDWTWVSSRRKEVSTIPLLKMQHSSEGKWNKSSSVQTFYAVNKIITASTNHNGANNNSYRANYWFLPVPRFFFFLTNPTQIKVEWTVQSRSKNLSRTGGGAVPM